jgi:putative ABC transport system ATP-binding protein
MGPSGCGKSTLLNLIGLLDEPGAGSIHVAGAPVASYKDKHVARLRNNTFGFIFQSFHLINDLRVIDNVELPLLYRDLSPRSASGWRARRWKKSASARAWTTIRTSCPAASSSAWRLRAVIAGQVLLADEPTGNLDSKMGR